MIRYIPPRLEWLWLTYRISGHCLDNLFYPFALAPFLRCYPCLLSFTFLLLAFRYGYESINLVGLSRCIHLLNLVSLVSPSLPLFLFFSFSFLFKRCSHHYHLFFIMALHGMQYDSGVLASKFPYFALVVLSYFSLLL